MSIYTGVGDIAKRVTAIYAGVNGTARKIVRAYAGDENGVAQLVYQRRVYLFRDGVDNTALTGDWAGSFTHKTNSGVNYSMTRLAVSGAYLQGSYSSSDGSSEKALYVRSNNAISLAGWNKLVCVLERYTSRASKTFENNKAYFGAFDSDYTTCKSNQLETRFLKYAIHSNNKNSAYTEVTLTVDISTLTGSYYIVYDNFEPNMNAAISIRIKEIWLE